MENTLKFNRSLSVKQFLAETNAESIKVRNNAKTGKNFFTAGQVTGAVGSEMNYKEDPVVSEVTGENDETFWLLHKAGGEVLDTLT